MTRLLLLRHAESEWNAQRRWQGSADPPLSPRGEQTARLAGPLLEPIGIGAVVSSDLQRARATAEPIAAALGVPGPIGIESGLREYDIGAWSGLTRSEIEAGWPGAINDWRLGRLLATPGGEERDAFEARISSAVNRVAASRPGATVLVITHGGVISALGRLLGGPPERFTHLAGLWIDSGPAGLRRGPTVSLLDSEPPATGEGEGTDLTASGVLDTGGR